MWLARTSSAADCFKDGSLQVTVKGSKVLLAGSDPEGNNITFRGSLDSTGTLLNLNYVLNSSASGMCESDDGSGTLGKALADKPACLAHRSIPDTGGPVLKEYRFVSCLSYNRSRRPSQTRCGVWCYEVGRSVRGVPLGGPCPIPCANPSSTPGLSPADLVEVDTLVQQRRLHLFVLPPRSPKLNGAVERANRTQSKSSSRSPLASWR